MGLDDFASEDEPEFAELAQPVASGSEPKAIDWDDPANEDLFDFEDETVHGAVTASSDTVDPQPEPVPSPEPEPDFAPTLDPAPVRAASAATPGSDPLLDEDLFGFGDSWERQQASDVNLDLTSADEALLAVTEEPSSLAELPAEIPEPPPAVAAPVPEPVPAPTPPAPAPVAPEPAAAAPTPADPPTPAPARAPLREPDPVAIDRQLAALSASMPSIEMPYETERPTARGRLPELLAISFLLVNSALILFAWQANDSFKEALVDVNRNVASALAGSATNQDLYASGPRNPMSQAAELAETGPETEEPSYLDSLHEQAIEFAKARLADGNYAAARLELFQMLANQDRGAIAVPEELIADAEFLIAESYVREAEALEGAE